MDNINVNGLMITVGMKQRGDLIKKTVKNFFNQDHPFKVLYILNQGKESIKEHFPNESIKEHFTKTIGITNLRNELLKKIDYGEICVQWDDDDIKPLNFISTLHEKMIREKLGGCLSKGTYYYDFDEQKFFEKTTNRPTTNSFMFKKNELDYNYHDIGEDFKFANRYKRSYNVEYVKLPIIKFVHNSNVYERKKNRGKHEKKILEYDYGNWLE